MESILTVITIAIFGLCLIFPIFHIGNAILALRKKPYYLEDMGTISEKSLAILVPCFNEETIMKTTISGIERLNYKNYEYVLINDGSTDHTFEMMHELLDLWVVKIKLESSLEFSTGESHCIVH
jgi:poly-beta-1,6-N-acetyl-D-glucosamine synthase